MQPIQLKETTDKKEIKKILLDSEIFDRITSDASNHLTDFDPPSNAQYIGGYVDNDIIALMVYHTSNKRLKCHLMVLKKYRNKYAKEFARMALNFGKAKNASVYAEIATCFKETLFFAKSLGFKQVGNIENKITRSGVFYDVNILRLDKCF